MHKIYYSSTRFFSDTLGLFKDKTKWFYSRYYTYIYIVKIILTKGINDTVGQVVGETMRCNASIAPFYSVSSKIENDRKYFWPRFRRTEEEACSKVIRDIPSMSIYLWNVTLNETRNTERRRRRRRGKRERERGRRHLWKSNSYPLVWADNDPSAKSVFFLPGPVRGNVENNAPLRFHPSDGSFLFSSLRKHFKTAASISAGLSTITWNKRTPLLLYLRRVTVLSYKYTTPQRES